MRIDFYSYNLHEIIVWDHIWKSLQRRGLDARFVVEPPGINTAIGSRPDKEYNNIPTENWVPLMTPKSYHQITEYLRSKDYPFEIRGDYQADAVITTQGRGWLNRYQGLKIKTAYGAPLQLDAYGYSEVNQGLDGVLVQGQFSQELIARWLPLNDVIISGYPKFAPYFRGEIDREEWDKYFQLDPDKKTIVYFSTWAQNSSLDMFAEVINLLTNKYNVIYKPHHNNLFFEQERLNKTVRSSKIIVADNLPSIVPFFAVSDLVLADLRSGSFSEGLLVGRPVVGLSVTQDLAKENVPEVTYQAAPICRNPQELPAMVDNILHHDTYQAWRQKLASYLFTNFEGRDDEVTADAIMDIIQRKTKKKTIVSPGIQLEEVQLDKYVPGNESFPLISVIIPTYNRSTILTKCLEALSTQTFPHDAFEVFVCDDGSADRTAEVVNNFSAPYKLVYLRQKNSGPGAARNLAIPQTSGKYLLFINDDTLLGPDALARHVDILETHQDQKIAVLGSFSLHPENIRTPFDLLLNHSDVLFAFCHLTPGCAYDYRFFYTCNTSIPRQAVLEAGLFDQDFPGPAAEDLELGYRLQKLGYKVYYDPSCIAFHDHRLSLEDFCNIHKRRGQGALILCKKHPQLGLYGDIANNLSVETINKLKEQSERNLSRIAELKNVIRDIENRHYADFKAMKKSAQEIYPIVKEIITHYEWEGILSNRSVELILNNFDQIEKLAFGKPLVSVIIPAYNKAKYIRQTLDSVLNQNYDNIEIIVVDDGSTDDTSLLLKDYLPRIKYLYKENDGYQGPGGAINFGVRHAQGEYIHCLDADDEVLPNFYLQVLGEFFDNSKIGAVASHAYLMDEAGKVKRLFRLGNFQDPEAFPLEALSHNPIISSSMVVKKECYEVLGGRRPEYEICDDYEFWLRISERYPIRLLHLPLIKYRWHEGGISQDINKTKKLDKNIVLDYLSRNSLEWFFPELKVDDTPEQKCAAYIKIGEIMYSRGYLDESFFYMRRALEYNVNSSEAHNNVAVLYHHFGDRKRAIEHCQQALAIDPANQEARKNLNCLLPVPPSLHPASIRPTATEAQISPDPGARAYATRPWAAGASSPPLRILLVAHNLEEQARAGTEVYCLKLGQALAESGADVLFLSSQGPSVEHPQSKISWREGRLAGLPWLQFTSINQDLFANLAHPGFEAAFREILARHHVDLVHFQHTYLTSISLLEVALKAALPVVLTLHDAWHVCLRLYCQNSEGTCTGAESVEKCTACITPLLAHNTPKNREKLQKFLKQRREYVAQLFPRVHVLAPSQFLRNLHYHSGVGRRHIIHLPLGLDELKSAPPVPLTSPPHFVFLGNIIPVKRVDLAITAFQTLAGQASLDIWGQIYDPNFEGSITPYSHIQYRGPYRREELPAILAGATAVIVPSNFENYPLVIREALMLKTPVIASRTGGIPEIVQHGENGLLFPPGNAAALRQMVVHLIRHPNLVERLRKGIKPVKTITQEAQELMELYHSLACSPPRQGEGYLRQHPGVQQPVPDSLMSG